MKVLANVLMVCLAMAIAPAVKATAQLSDLLILEGKEFALNTNPLANQLQKKQWKPPKEALISSANWRGYLATWEIKGGKLFLKDVSIAVINPKDEHDDIRKSITRDLYPGAAEVFADWYTGALIVPDGKMTRYVHMGYGSSFDHYQVFRVHAGKIVEHLSMTDAEFEAYKEKKFAVFRKTEAYAKAYADFRKEAPDLSKAQAEDFIRSYFAETYLSQ
ncbi:hypothetical protein LJR125_000861 [Pseudoxanthomonas sp. LjRoot125]|uniref:hypothetical protein n=1 Tax=Pseudoxanthomonas sp. LjRoot125 TaxID=3342258 RepID=UPI003E115780